jgi:hypothetical protein
MRHFTHTFSVKNKFDDCFFVIFILRSIFNTSTFTATRSVMGRKFLNEMQMSFYLL